jgi:beta-glucosidase
MKYKALIDRMTLEEKASLLSGLDFWQTKPIKRLNVPSMFLSDGPHGIRKQAGAADQLGLNASVPATCFPTAATMANSWDPILGEELGRMLGEEAVEQGVNVLLGPGLNVKRSPLCGRNFEYFSEDPYLAGKMAASYVRGIQSKGVAACPKHFAANSQELLRIASDSVMDQRTLHEIYLTGFEIVVKEANPKSLMSAYNKVNGIYANENKYLLQHILREEWGFEGFVVSDWGGSNDHVVGVEAGSHLEMPTTGTDSDRELVAAVENGDLTMEQLDQRVDEFLSVLFDVTKATKEAKGEFDVDSHHKFALKAAEESIVLLKNENNILPLKAHTKIALIGEFAMNPRYQGAGSSVVNSTRLDSIKNCIWKTGFEVAGYEPGYIRTGRKNEQLITAACELAKNVDVVLLYIGLDEISESEGLDRKHMKLPQNQIDLIEALGKLGTKIIAVLSAGSAIEMPWINNCEAVIHGYLSGQAGAEAMLKALTGEINPSGKLSESYPLRYEDVSNQNYYPGYERTAEYREGLYIGYRYFDTAQLPVLFPFGYGLSYASFEYSELQVTEKEATFTIKNTGSREGKEIAQLYVRSLDGKVFRPAKELKGFRKIKLAPGESKNVRISFDDKTFRYFNVDTNRFEVESGNYEIMIGASSRDIKLKDTLYVQGTDAVSPYNPIDYPSYYSGKITRVPDQEFELLLGRPIPETKWNTSLPLERNDAISQLFYAKSGLARLVYKILTGIKNRSEAKGKPDLNILFIYNMPFRGIAKMAGGAINLDMVDGILKIVNGHFFKGVGHLVGALVRLSKANADTKKKLENAKK